MGSLGEGKCAKKGSFSDRRFENGGQCGRTYPSHIFRECPPPPGTIPSGTRGTCCILDSLCSQNNTTTTCTGIRNLKHTAHHWKNQK